MISKAPILDPGIAVILASGSPRRRELLRGMGIVFEVCVSDADETPPAGATPAEAVAVIARRKAEAVLGEVAADTLVIAADTTVDLDGVSLGKPRSEDEALSMLLSLSGRTHHVHTGVAVAYRGRLLTATDTTAVTFRAYPREAAEDYVRTGEPMDKAGAYGIQGLGGALVAGIRGEFDNVVGLPCALLARLIAEVTK